MADPLHIVLKQAIDASRKALADLDADQVPADLRRVYTSPGGRLPPPLVETLLSGLDRYEWLREKALEVWDDADSAAGGPAGAAAGFLQREGTWVRVLARAVAKATEDGGTTRSQALLRRLADAEGMVELVRSRHEAERRSMVDELTRVRKERDVARSANRESAASESRERERTEARAAEDRLRAATLAAELAEALGDFEAANEAVRDERRARVAAEHLLAELDSRSGWWADDPI